MRNHAFLEMREKSTDDQVDAGLGECNHFAAISQLEAWVQAKVDSLIRVVDQDRPGRSGRRNKQRRIDFERPGPWS